MDKKELLDRIHNLKTLGSIKNIKQVLLGLLNLGDKEEVQNLQEITDKGSTTTNDIIVIDEINGAVTTISSGGVFMGGEDGKSHGINPNPLGTVVSYGEGGDSNYLIIEKDKAVFSKPVQGVDAVAYNELTTLQQVEGLLADIPTETPTLQEVLNKGNTATGAIEVEEGVFNKIILGQWEISVDADGSLITTAIL